MTMRVVVKLTLKVGVGDVAYPWFLGDLRVRAQKPGSVPHWISRYYVIIPGP
jgi:hypothetical protein